VQRAACAILVHPGVTARSAGRWFANYLNLPKPQPRRPRKPQLPSSWPPLDTRPFLLFYPQFLSSSRHDLHPTIRFLSACLPILYLPTYLPTYLPNSFLLTLARVIVARLLQLRFENLASFDHTTLSDQSTVLAETRALCFILLERSSDFDLAESFDDGVALTRRSPLFRIKYSFIQVQRMSLA